MSTQMEWIGRDLVLPHALARRATETPDRVHLHHVDGTTLTYRQSHEECLRWASAMTALGVTAGDNVLSLLPNSPTSYHLWIGLSWLGAVEVSLSTDYRGRMLRYTVNSASAEIIVVPADLLPRFSEVAGDLPKLRTIVVLGDPSDEPAVPQQIVSATELLEQATVRPFEPPHDPAPWDVCCLLWTSGTTGPSKGVLVPWSEMFIFTHVVEGMLAAGDVTYHYLPPHHNSGKVLFTAAVLHDLPIVMRETFSVSSFWQDVHTHAVTHAVLFEPMVRMLQAAPLAPADADNPLRRIGVAPVPDDIDDFLQRFGLEGANTFYGMTEIGLPFASDGLTLANTDSCGRLRADQYEVRIVDDHDYSVAAGEVGELIVRSRHPWTMNAGYYGMPERTAEAWRNGWFHTGDAFRTDSDGNYYFVDRLKDAIRRRGENISSFEVEAHVLDHPDVAECAAVAAPSELGEDEVKIFIVLTDGNTLAPDQLLAWLEPQIPRFMLPRFVEVIDDLPRTEATYRTRKAELRALGHSSRTWDREADRYLTE